MRLHLAPLLLVALAASCTHRPTDSEVRGGVCRRVVAYSPALAQIMFELGLGDAVVGVSRWTVLPPGISRPVVGDVKSVDTEAILAVRPDCIFTQVSTPDLIDGLRRVGGARVELFVIEQLPEVRAAVARLARLVGRPDAGRRSLEKFDARLAALRAKKAADRPRVLFVLGTDRPAVALGDSFVDDLIAAAGGVNAGKDVAISGRWRSTELEAIVRARPDVLVCQVSSAAAEPAAREYWRQWSDLPAARTGRVHVVSDPSWTIPTLRLAEQAEKLRRMIHLPAPAAELAADAGALPGETRPNE